MDLRIERIGPLKGRSSVPGDKSISHRAAMFNAIASGDATITGFSPAEDCRSTVKAMRALGVEIIELAPDKIAVKGRGLRGLLEPSDVVDVGNSGTTIRMLPGILAGQNFYTVLTGDASIRRRPMKRVVEPLRLMGADIQGRANDTLAPLTIKGGDLKAIEYETPVPSAQVKSTVLLAGLYAEGETVVIEKSLSRDHTERMLKAMGADIALDADVKSGTAAKARVAISGGRELQAVNVEVPGDFSSAAFLIVAALLIADSQIELTGVGVNPTRTGALEVLRSMGAAIEVFNERESAGEAIADLRASTTELKAAVIEGEIIPRLIDEIPILAVAATRAEGETLIREARELRVKESDRIAAFASELRKMGADINELEDGMAIRGSLQLKGAEVESHGDHRIAMSLAIAGLLASGETLIHDAECIDISYPGFYRALIELSK